MAAATEFQIFSQASSSRIRSIKDFCTLWTSSSWSAVFLILDYFSVDKVWRPCSSSYYFNSWCLFYRLFSLNLGCLIIVLLLFFHLTIGLFLLSRFYFLSLFLNVDSILFSFFFSQLVYFFYRASYNFFISYSISTFCSFFARFPFPLFAIILLVSGLVTEVLCVSLSVIF